MAQINKSSEYFNTVLYTGNGSTNTITGVGFQPDWTLLKDRNDTSGTRVYDSVRGAIKRIRTDTTDAEIDDSDGLTAFGSDGFTLGADGATNANSTLYVSWNWLGANGTASNTDGSITSTVSANTTSGFSIVTWTGNSTASQSVGHGLGAVPKVILTKNTDNGSQPWKCYFSEVGNADYLQINTTDAPTTSGVWNNTTPSSSLIYISNDVGINGSGNTIVAYCFAEKKGFSKFGSYVGNGNADGTFVYTGFKPAMVIIKNTTTAGTNWNIHDSARDTDNPVEKYLHPNTTDAEPTTIRDIDFLSNGFKPRTGNSTWNGSGDSYIYMAFAESPLVGTNNTPATAR